jgi:hypothetical protein
MLIGHHFGKRKPQWNFFIKSYERFKYGDSSKLIKMILTSLAMQFVLILPIIYWIHQNYSIIETRIPVYLDLHENIQFEKKWIIFLILGIFTIQGFWNYYIVKTFLKYQMYQFEQPVSNGKPVLHDVTDYQHRAS